MSRWRGKAASRATQSVAPSQPRKARSKRGARSVAPQRREFSAHATIPRSLGGWCAFGNLPAQAATQTVLINVRQQFTLTTSTSNDINMFFYPGANDTIGWYTNGTTNVALANNSVTGGGYSTLTIPMLTSLLNSTPKTSPEWRPTRLWVRVHNTTIFTGRVGGCLVTRPKGSWSTFAPGVVGPGQVVSQANLTALPETRFYDFSQMSGPTDYLIATFPTDLEAFSYFNTTAPDTPGLSTNWLDDVTRSGQKWAPLNFYLPAASSQQTVVFEVYASYDCKIAEALTATSPMATLAAAPPVGPPHTVISEASQALGAGSNNMSRLAAGAATVGGVGLGMLSASRGLRNSFGGGLMPFSGQGRRLEL